MSKSGWKSKPIQKKPLTHEIANYNAAATGLNAFRDEHTDVLEALDELELAQGEAREILADAAKKLPLGHGVHQLAKLADGLTLQLDMKSARRSVDPKLLEDHPRLVSYANLFTIKVSGLDAAVAGKLLTAKQAKKYIESSGKLSPAISFVLAGPEEE